MSTYPSPEHQFISSSLGTDTSSGSIAQKRPKTTANGKRGRKAKNINASTPQEVNTPQTLQWTQPAMPAPSASQSTVASGSQPGGATGEGSSTQAVFMQPTAGPSGSMGTIGAEGSITAGVVHPAGPSGAGLRSGTAGPGGAEEEGEGEDELLPAMADDDYSAQLSWQSQSKDNLKVLMDNFTPEQYERFEAYRRHALPKQAVRKVIQQTLGQQVSMPVAQVVAGFSKVFVGEIVEKARDVQARRGDTGPLSPDHLREAYRMYQQETGRVGAARPIRSKKLFVR